MHRWSILLLAVLAVAANAEEELRPKWELGAGLGSQTLADYRGAKNYSTQFLPIPYISYRGDFLRADDKGFRGRFISTDRIELNISLAGSLNGDSDDNRLREGMPELHPAGEVGPSLDINLTGENFSEGWSLRLPLRGVYTIDVDELEIDNVGYLINPQFTYESLDWNGWNGSLDLGFLYGSSKYHDHYYSVAQEFVTDDRPFYRASSGYSGSYFNFSMTKRQGRWWYGGYLRYDNLRGATFEESPLMETNHYFTLALGVAYIFAQSKVQVMSPF